MRVLSLRSVVRCVSSFPFFLMPLPPSLTHFSSFLCPCISLPSFSPSLSDHALYRCFFPSFFARPLSQYALIWLCKITFQVQQLSVFRAFSHSLPSPLIQPLYIQPCSISTFSCINYPASPFQQICMFPFDRLPIDCILAIAFPIQLHSPFHSFFSLSHHYSFLFPSSSHISTKWLMLFQSIFLLFSELLCLIDERFGWNF